MTADELREQGHRLARPCVWLRDTGPKNDVGAMWGGPGIVPPPKKGLRHWLSIDCGWYKEVLHRYGHKIGPTTGVLSVYTGDEGGVAVHDRAAKLAKKRGSIPLYAHPGRSLPPIEAVFLRGSPSIQAWLKDNKWKAEWGYNDNFKGKKPAKEYLKAYQELCPLYGKSMTAHAVLGGWHFPWPDGDWEERVDRALLVWTFEDSEPWVEVWADGKGYEVLQRIT